MNRCRSDGGKTAACDPLLQR